MGNTTAGVGYSTNVDPQAAVAEALAAALASGDAPPRLAIVYATVSYDQAALLAAVGDRLPGVPVVGASTSGVAINGMAVEAGRCLAATVLRSDDLRVRVASAEGLNKDPFRCGREVAEKLGPRPPGPSATFLWFDILTGANIAALLAGLAEGGHPAVVGGASGQPWGIMVQTFQYAGDRALSNSAVALLIEGVEPVYDMTHGMEPIGLELTITRARDNVIEEINGRPALDVWCEQLGVEPSRDIDVAGSWAFGIRPPVGVPYESMFTRTPFQLDPATRTITLPVPIPAGTRAHVCVRTQAGVFDRALAMGRRMADALRGRRPLLALSFECAGRPGPFLGPEKSNEEIVEIQSLIGGTIPWLGMYAWGEICPLGGRSEFHNYTLPLCVLCEPETPADR
jgi:hypothetical protein